MLPDSFDSEKEEKEDEGFRQKSWMYLFREVIEGYMGNILPQQIAELTLDQFFIVSGDKKKLSNNLGKRKMSLQEAVAGGYIKPENVNFPGDKKKSDAQEKDVAQENTGRKRKRRRK